MKQLCFTLTTLLFFTASFITAQVGIGTNTPDASAMLEISAQDKGVLFPSMSSALRQAITAPATGLYVFDTDTASLWNYNGTVWVNTVTEATLGDVKSGFQAADHAGWVRLDGRAFGDLTTEQAAVAATLFRKQLTRCY